MKDFCIRALFRKSALNTRNLFYKKQLEEKIESSTTCYVLLHLNQIEDTKQKIGNGNGNFCLKGLEPRYQKRENSI